jgi:hypothetical protein
MADGLFYEDTREPHFVSNLGAIPQQRTRWVVAKQLCGATTEGDP